LLAVVALEVRGFDLEARGFDADVLVGARR
jgi:hypothetical protein